MVHNHSIYIIWSLDLTEYASTRSERKTRIKREGSHHLGKRASENLVMVTVQMTRVSEEDDQTREERTLKEEAMGWNQHPAPQL